MDVAASYIELGLRLGRHIDGLVDAYYGPPELGAAGGSRGARKRPPSSPRTRQQLRESTRRRAGCDAQLVGPGDGRQASGRRGDRLRGRGRALLRRPPAADSRGRLRGGSPRARRGAARRRARSPSATRPGARATSCRPIGSARSSGAGRRPPRADAKRSSASRTRASSSSTSPTSRGRRSTTTSAACAAGSRSTPTCAMTPDFVAELAAHEAYPGHHTEHVTKEQTLVRDAGPARGVDPPGRDAAGAHLRRDRGTRAGDPARRRRGTADGGARGPARRRVRPRALEAGQEGPPSARARRAATPL